MKKHCLDKKDSTKTELCVFLLKDAQLKISAQFAPLMWSQFTIRV